MSTLPPFASFPSSSIRSSLPLGRYPSILSAFTSLAAAVTALSDSDFKLYLSENGPSLTAFLTTSYSEIAASPRIPGHARLVEILRGLFTRAIIECPGVIQWEIFAAAAAVDRANVWMMLDTARGLPGRELDDAVGALRRSLLRILEMDSRQNLQSAEKILRRLNHLLAVDKKTGASFAAGDDFMDAMSVAFQAADDGLKRILVTTGYLCLTSLLDSEERLLGDRLYALTANGGGDGSYVQVLVSTTPLLAKLEKAGETNQQLQTRAAALKKLQKDGMLKKPERLVALESGQEKGKGKAQLGIPMDDDIKALRLSLIASVKEFLPGLGDGFVWRLSEALGDQQEAVVAALLDDALPEGLKNANREELLTDDFFFIIEEASTQISRIPLPAPPPAPVAKLPTRRNVFDDDEFDHLSTTIASSLRINQPNTTADDVLEDKTTAPSKAAIMSALMAFDADDDERDDTYDADDVGAAVDSEDSFFETDQDEILWKIYQQAPVAFERSKEGRHATHRQKLKDETGMTDEAIEGWGVMLGRSPLMKRRLERKFGQFDGEQAAITSTKWSQKNGDEEGEDHSGDKRRGGRPRSGGGRGGRGGGAGRGGSSAVAGPTGDKNTERARKHKEANKSKSANHDRKTGHSKKMARGGFGE